MSSERFCILLTKCLGKKKEKKFMKSSTSKVEILPGTLLLLLDVIKNSAPPNQLQFVLETLDQEDVEVTCSRDDFNDISRDEYELLINVPTCADRYQIFMNKEWMQEGQKMKVGDYVEVYDKASAKDLIGILRFRGHVHGLNGIHFGVELVYNKGQGHSDGMFRNQRYFQCAPESALFVGLHRIRQHKGPPPQRQSDIAGASAANVYSQYGKENAYGLKMGDRIVWISDEGPEAGVVKWIGLLPDCRADDDITVGVEFDHPVGSGTGKYRDQRLFTAKQNHASLVPILGLMKEEEYRNESRPVDSENALAAFTEAGCIGKTQEEVIEEQRRIMEEARLQKFSPRLPADGTQQPDIKHEKKNSFEVVEHAMVHAAPSSNVQTPPAACKGFPDTKGINPLYEYSRSKH
ncbi:CAP-Gly domain-containing linker protein 3-like, partial [Mercenaria mercenaria]